MGRGVYSGEGFIRAWNAGNRFGYPACMSPTPEGERTVSGASLDCMPRSVVEAHSRWNFDRLEMREKF
jgi:hypothetical protein